MSRLTAALAIPLLAGLVAGCAGKGPAYEATPADVAAVVYMTDTFAFSPETVTVPANTTVQWSNRSLMTHSVSTDPARVKDPKDVALPEGAEPFDSGDIGRGQVWRHTFTTPGTYRYVCRQHEWLGMAGTVEVTP